MICPKCGRKTEGSLCPYCDEPQIDDNTDEYLKRKSAYENSLKTASEEEEQPAGVRKFKRKHAIAAFIVIGAALTAAIVTTHLPRLYDGKIYAASEDGILLLNGGEPEKLGGRIYLSDGKCVYADPAEPDEIKGGTNEQLKGYAASSNGEYFALSRLEENNTDDNYSLYVWNKNGEYAKVLSYKGIITVRDVTDTGEIIFTTSPVLNDQWYTGEDTLHIYKVSGATDGTITGEIKKVSDSVQSFFIYENADALVCLERNGQLFSCPGYDTENRIIIAEGVTKVLAENDDEDNFFSSSAPGVNINTSADLLAYFRDGIWTMTDTGARIALTLGAAGEDARFIYDDSDRVIYKAEANDLARSIVSDSGLTEWVSIGSIGTDIVWDAYKSVLIFETQDALLKRAGRSEEVTICENEKKSTLKKIYNGEGYIFDSAEGLYISRDIKAMPELIKGDVTGEIKKCAAYKDIIYIFAGDSLYAIDKNNNASFIGQCEGLYVV